MKTKILFMLLLFSFSFAEDISPYLSDKQFKTGMQRFHNREYEAAIQIFNKALSIYPMNLKARYYLGLSFLQAGYVKNSIDEWENLIKLGGGNYLIKQKLNDLYFSLSLDRKHEYSSPYTFSSFIENKNKLGRPSFIIYDEKMDRFLVSSIKKKYVIELDANGNILREIGRKVGDFSSFKMPTGLYIYADNIYVADYKLDTIFVFNRDGKFLNKKIGSKGFGESNISGPMGIYIKDDYIFVVNNGNDRVQKFSITGEWIQSIGTGELKRPTDIAGEGDYIYISDTGNKRIIVYDIFGNFVSSISSEQLSQPRGLAIKNKKLYISDAIEGLFIYDIDKEMFEKISISKEKLNLPFDVAIDTRNILYETDFNTFKIAVFTPLELQYANLNVQTTQIWLDNYPRNFIHLRVFDKAGNPVYDLKEENFLVYEEGTFVPIIKLGATYSFRKNMYAKIIIDKSIKMKEYEEDLIEIVRAFLEKTTGDDWIDIKVLSKDVETTGRIKASVLSPLEFIKKQEYSETLNNLDTSIYDSIRELLNINRNKAIILITAEDLNQSFSTYDLEMLINYARNNSIPIYVINFNPENKNSLELLSAKTFGRYYSLKEYKDILNIYETIKNSKPLEYIINYDGMNLKGLKNFFVNVNIKVKYKGLIGVDEIGYYVPEYFLPLNFFGQKKEMVKEYK